MLIAGTQGVGYIVFIKATAHTWVAFYDDIIGLTPAQLKQKYALPDIPDKFVFVGAQSGQTVRYGIAGSNIYGTGGGIQIDAMGTYWDIGNVYYDLP